VLRRDDVDERHHRADGEVDAAAQDHDRLPARRERERQRVDRQGLHVERPPGEVRLRAPVEDEQKQQHVRADGPAVAANEPAEPRARPPAELQGACGHATASSPTSPCIARRSDASSAAAPGSSAVISPPKSVSTRSQTSGNSASSLEKKRIAAPSSASRLSSAYTWRFVPTSIPRVGSKQSMVVKPPASQRAIVTFCWLPPDSRRT